MKKIHMNLLKGVCKSFQAKVFKTHLEFSMPFIGFFFFYSKNLEETRAHCYLFNKS